MEKMGELVLEVFPWGCQPASGFGPGWQLEAGEWFGWFLERVPVLI